MYVDEMGCRRGWNEWRKFLTFRSNTTAKIVPESRVSVDTGATIGFDTVVPSNFIGELIKLKIYTKK